MKDQTRRSRVYEILGSPGAGKTSLAKEICKHNSHVRLIGPHSVLSYDIVFSNIEYFFSLVQVLLSVTRFRQGQWFLPTDILAIYRLIWWQKYLAKQDLKMYRSTIIDEGPVGILSWLLEFSSDYHKKLQPNKFLKRYYDYLAQSYCAVVILHIPSKIALDRVCNRDPDHWIGNMPFESAIEHLDRINHAQAQIASILSA